MINLICKSSLINVTAVSSFNKVLGTPINVYQGANKIIFPVKIVFSTTLSNVYFWSNDTQITFYYSNDVSQYDLMWSSNRLQRVDPQNYLKFNLQLLTEQLIYEETVSISHTYFNPGQYNIMFNFSSYWSLSKVSTVIWNGILYLNIHFIHI